MIKITNQANLKFQMMTDNLQVGILKCRVDKYLSIEEINDGFVQLLEYTAEDMENCFHNRLSECVYGEDLPVFQSLQEGIAQGKIYVTAEFRIPGKSGNVRWYRLLALTQFEDKGTPSSAIGIIFNIDNEMQAMDRLRSQAEQDSLTGLYNRKETEKRIKQFLNSKPELSCALFMVDMDNFKQINDTKGHMVGDVVLTEAASAMKSLMRATDLVGRIGGDEFIIFMKDIPSRAAAEKKAQRLADIFRHLFEHEKFSVPLSCSIGVAVYPEDGQNFKTLYMHADQALYHAKTSGKNTYVLYDSGQIYHQENTGRSPIGAHIDSESRAVQGLGDFLTDIFKILYRMENPDQAINLILEIVGKKFDVSRAYIFESTENGKYTSNTYEWCSDGVKPQIDLLQNLSYSQFGDYHTLFEDNSIFYCRDIHTLHPKQRDLLGEQGICSTLQCAFWRGEDLAGFIGFDECTGLRLWTEEEVDILSLIAQMMTIFLQKRRAMDWYSEMELQLHTILDSKESCIYVIDQDSFELLYLSQKAKEFKSRVQLGELCYRAIFGRDNICEFCPLLNGGTGYLNLPEYGMKTELHASSMKWLGNDAYLLSFCTGFDGAAASAESSAAVMSERSLADCLQWLASAEYQDDAIAYVLGVVQNYYRSDRVYIIEVDMTRGIANNTYEICAEGVAPQRDLLQDLPLETMSFWMEQFAVKGYIKINDIEELGTDRQLEYNILKKQGIRSLMAIPLSGQGGICGFLGVDDPKQNKKNFHYLRGLSYFLESELAKNSLKKNMELMIYQDAMTGFENRNSFVDYCEDFSQRMPAPAGDIYMDINGLKQHTDLNESLHSADRLMYLKKQAYYRESRTNSIPDKEYPVYVQPKLNLKSGRIDSAEVLARCREADGSIADIDFFVMEEACRLLTSWRGTAFADIRLALNFSRTTLLDTHFFEKFWDIFSRYDIKPDQLEIEIAESRETLNQRQIPLLLKRLKNRGFGIALDGFGAEYSSYGFLITAGFDLLKIDKGIVQRLGADGKCEILVTHIVEMCRELGIKCCAEGVDSEEQRRFISDVGCDYAQGRLIGDPIPPEQLKL